MVAIERNGNMVPVAKLSPGKQTLPGEKQVWRIGRDGDAERDLIGLAGEPAPPHGVPVLSRVVRHGVRTSPRPSLQGLRADSRAARSALPTGVRRLRGADRFPVESTPMLVDLTRAHRVAGR